MLERSNRPLRWRVLVVDDEIGVATAEGRAVGSLVQELQSRGIDVIDARSAADGLSVVASDASLHAVIVDWHLSSDDPAAERGAVRVLEAVRARNATVPIFLTAERQDASAIPLYVMQMANEFVWMLEDTPGFVGGRIHAAIRRYAQGLLPPFAAALLTYDREREHSWAAPGHQGGVAFTKSPVGRVFFDFFGEQVFRTDMGIERPSLGSLLGHTGPVGESERLAARVFGADRTYFGVNGTSGSNRAILTACVGDGELALCDRNAHKSIEQGLALTGGIPVFLVPRRNRYGIIGPIPPAQFDAAAVAARVAAHPLAPPGAAPVYAVVTNSTYDGLCYDAVQAEAQLGRLVDRVHFDEAWYAHARFHPLYRERHAMRGDASSHGADAPTVFATHSTHKLLAALSQAAMIHVRDGRRPVEHGRFNEAYCLQASTSPLYAIVASNDVAAAMMDGPGGYALTQEAVLEAVDCRQAFARVREELAAEGEWFFSPWNPPDVPTPDGRGRMPFHDAPAEWLANVAECWMLRPDEAWHGFGDLPDGWCMLDPTKLALVCPGMGDDGRLLDVGVPADLVTAFLGRHGIVPSRTTDHMVLFLFSIGVTKGKWGTLVNALLDFKEQYDRNAPLSHALPAVAAAAPARYAGLGLRDLGEQMWAHLRESGQGALQADACARLPTPVMTPRQAFQALMAGPVERLPLASMAHRTAAVGVIPYPPGIPIVMPGEDVGPADGPWLRYVQALEAWGAAFPGFEKDVEGAERRDGKYYVYCVA